MNTSPVLDAAVETWRHLPRRFPGHPELVQKLDTLLDNSVANPAIERQRAAACVSFYTQRWLPYWLRLVPNLAHHADQIESTPPPMNDESAREIGSACRAAYEDSLWLDHGAIRAALPCLQPSAWADSGDAINNAALRAAPDLLFLAAWTGPCPHFTCAARKAARYAACHHAAKAGKEDEPTMTALLAERADEFRPHAVAFIERLRSISAYTPPERAIHPSLLEKLPAVREVCKSFSVKEMWAIGSATGPNFIDTLSDFDFAVQNGDRTPELRTALQNATGRYTDLAAIPDQHPNSWRQLFDYTAVRVWPE